MFVDQILEEIRQLRLEIAEVKALLEPKPKAKPKVKGYSEAFEAFWREYPNKQGKAAAYRAWQRYHLNSKADQIIEDVRKRKASDPQWLAEDGKYIPHGSTWINNQRWEDDISEAPGAQWGDLSDQQIQAAKAAGCESKGDYLVARAAADRRLEVIRRGRA